MNTIVQPAHTRRSQIAALLLLLTVIAGMVALFMLPTLWLHRYYDESIDDSLDKLKRYQRIAALRPTIEATITEVEKLAGNQYYLHASSSNLAAAELQSLATRLVEKNKGRVISTRVHPQKEDSKDSGPVRVSIDVQLAASIVPLQLVLHAIETHVPYLFIEKATITSKHGRAYKVEPGVQPEYDIQLTIAAYVLPGGVQQP